MRVRSVFLIIAQLVKSDYGSHNWAGAPAQVEPPYLLRCL